MLCIVALIFLLPHAGVSAGGKQAGQTGSPGTGNILTPSSTILQTTTTNQTTTTTITSTGTTNTPVNNTSQYIQQLLNPFGNSTTTILYAYCVGSPSPPFNQSYYSKLDFSGAVAWNATTSYPIPFLGGSCTSTGGTVYCVGDSMILFSNRTNRSYYAGVSQSGIGKWAQTSRYPIPFSLGSCSASNGYIYCVGTLNQSDSRDVFYAPLTASGIGPWSKTTSYPAPFYGAQCNAYNGYLYCIGDTYLNASAILGVTETVNQILADGGISYINPPNESNDFYAPISASGVGKWKRINPTPIPIDGGSCTVSNATIYCIGGSPASLGMEAFGTNYTQLRSTANLSSIMSQVFGNETSASFYAPISASGSIGNWTVTASYPMLLQNAQCTSNGSNIYCMGGSSGNSTQAVFYSELSPTIGIGGWLPTTDYPIPLYSAYCSTNAADS